MTGWRVGFAAGNKEAIDGLSGQPLVADNRGGNSKSQRTLQCRGPCVHVELVAAEPYAAFVEKNIEGVKILPPVLAVIVRELSHFS
jgi:aspartate/methionine/tyrosine aminotransferase